MLKRCIAPRLQYHVAPELLTLRPHGNSFKHASAWLAYLPISPHSSRPPSTSRRWASTWSSDQSFDDPSDEVEDVAILGGGITGLAAAHYITEELPSAKVTIYESKPELGGWLRSKVVDVGDGEVIFESGPRSLRPGGANGTLTLRLIEKLGLIDDVLVTPRTSAAARNRYIYHPDRLVRMPTPGPSEFFHNVRTVFREPAFAGLLETIAARGITAARPSVPKDESIGDFLSKRIGQNATNSIASALYHGIYAGDIWQLSAKSVIPAVFEAEKRHGSLLEAFVDGVFKKEGWAFADDMELQMKIASGGWLEGFKEKFQGASVYTLRKGIGELVEVLERRLSWNRNVKIKRRTSVTKIERDGDIESDQSPSLRVSHQQTNTTDPAAQPTTSVHTHLISTLRGPLLTNLIDPSSSSSAQRLLSPATANALSSVPTVTVSVVNLYYSTPSLLSTLAPPRSSLSSALSGFGYLIPNSVDFTQNPERALGVIFDSDISPSLHTTLPPEKVGTRLTVMLGGHWWDGWSAYPNEDDTVAMARLVLERHLGLTEEPVVAQATLQRDCISQYTVGHTERMGVAHEGLLEAFKGRVTVAGSAYGAAGVGVNDCVRGAWDVVAGLKESDDGSIRGLSRTGLEKFREGRPMVRVKRNAGEVVVIGMDDDVIELGYFKDKL